MLIVFHGNTTLSWCCTCAVNSGNPGSLIFFLDPRLREDDNQYADFRAYCAEIIASFTTRANFAISDFRYSPYCSGVPPTMTAPTAALFSWMSGSFMIAFSSLLSLVMISFGVPAGAATADHEELS